MSTPARSWIFTINNYTDEESQLIKAIPCARIIAGFEVGEEGTPHIQGAIVFTRAMRLNAVRNALGGRAHVEKMRGTWSQQDYCVKDGQLLRLEDNTQQGKRADLIAFKDDLKRGISEDELIEDHLQVIAKYPRLENRLRQVYDKSPDWREVNVKVLWGAPGVGKTRKAVEEGAWPVPITRGLQWWNGYCKQLQIVIDDFAGAETVCIHRLKRLLDGYPLQVETKGGFVWAHWTTVYITSNHRPEDWYPGTSMTDFAALRRRISSVTEVRVTEVGGNTGRPLPKG